MTEQMGNRRLPTLADLAEAHPEWKRPDASEALEAPTMEDVLRLEPRVAEVLDDARKFGKRRRWQTRCDAWIDTFRPRLDKLVGWWAQVPQLRSCRAYDVVADLVLERLGL